MKTNSDLTNIVVSYFPLFRPDPTKDVQECLQDNTQTASGFALGCMWILDKEGNLVPVLIYNNCDEIVEHLFEWSEFNPEGWFDFHWAQSGPNYAMVLFPNLQKTVERSSINFQLRTGYPMPKGKKVNIVFEPLNFAAKGRVIDMVQDRIDIYAVDSSLMPASNDPELIMKVAKFIGNFQVNKNTEMMKSYIEPMLNES